MNRVQKNRQRPVDARACVVIALAWIARFAVASSGSGPVRAPDLRECLPRVAAFLADSSVRSPEEWGRLPDGGRRDAESCLSAANRALRDGLSDFHAADAFETACFRFPAGCAGDKIAHHRERLEEVRTIHEWMKGNSELARKVEMGASISGWTDLRGFAGEYAAATGARYYRPLANRDLSGMIDALARMEKIRTASPFAVARDARANASNDADLLSAVALVQRGLRTVNSPPRRVGTCFGENALLTRARAIYGSIESIATSCRGQGASINLAAAAGLTYQCSLEMVCIDHKVSFFVSTSPYLLSGVTTDVSLSAMGGPVLSYGCEKATDYEGEFLNVGVTIGDGIGVSTGVGLGFHRDRFLDSLARPCPGSGPECQTFSKVGLTTEVFGGCLKNLMDPDVEFGLLPILVANVLPMLLPGAVDMDEMRRFGKVVLGRSRKLKGDPFAGLLPEKYKFDPPGYRKFKTRQYALLSRLAGGAHSQRACPELKKVIDSLAKVNASNCDAFGVQAGLTVGILPVDGTLSISHYNHYGYLDAKMSAEDFTSAVGDALMGDDSNPHAGAIQFIATALNSPMDLCVGNIARTREWKKTQ